ncbi:MAG: nucleotidyltransferase [Saprospiraceae bacterium]
MTFLQVQFEAFNTNIQLSDIEDNSVLREKRKMLVDEIKKWCKDNDKPSFDDFPQGSYSMNTGIMPMEGEDYDIDIGLLFNIDIDDYKDPVEVKEWVYDALDRYPRTVEMKTPCVRVQYHEKGEVAYHVDFAIYGKNLDFLGNVSYLALAKGKLHSAVETRVWDKSSPYELKKLIREKFSGEERPQFKRAIRYLKRWKDFKFSPEGNERPTGIAMTAMAYNWFVPVINDGYPDDFTAITDLVEKICSNNYGLDVRLPVIPYNDLHAKLKQSINNRDNYITKLKKLRDILVEAGEEDDEHEAAKKLQKVFGDDFPVPDKKMSARVTGAPAITTSGASA